MASHQLKNAHIFARLMLMLCSMALASGTAAMGLGEIQVKSLLNEPLVAEVNLSNIGSLDPTQILVSLGAEADYKRVGIERDYTHTRLKFEVVIAAGAKDGLIRITTRDKIVEPYLDFLVDVRWPTGRILRDFTVLLDLPAYKQTPPVPVVVRAAQDENLPSDEPAYSRQPGSSAPAADGGQQIIVAENDTLWGIASRHKPSGQVTLHQTMIAIQQINPTAFLHNNINLLQAGAVLVLPTEQQAMAVAARDSIAAVQEQTQQWQEETGIDAGAKAQPVTSSDDIATPAAPEDGSYSGHLQLASGGSASGNSGQGNSTENEQRIERLRGALASTSEELDATKREKLELQQRIMLLEDQLATLDQIDSLKAGFESDELASLQAAAIATEQASEAMLSEDGEIAGEADSVTDDMAPAKASKKPDRKPVVISEPEEEVFPETWMLVAGGLIVLAGIAFIIWRRRYAYSEFEFEETHPVLAAVPVAAPAVPVKSKKKARRSVDPSKILESAFELFENGRAESAVEMLTEAVESEPYRSDLRIGLLQMLASIEDTDAVERQYAALRAIGSNEDLERADEILSRYNLLTEAESKVSTPVAESPKSQLDDELPLDLDDEIFELTDVLPSEEVIAESTPTGRVATAPAAEQSLDLDLDLDLDDLDLSSSGDELDLDSLEFDLEDIEEEAAVVAPQTAAEVELELPDISDLEIDSEHLDDIFDEQTVGPELDLDLGGGEAMDAVSTKLELAEAYIDMGDHDAAREILDEVISDGDEAQQSTARQMLGSIS